MINFIIDGRTYSVRFFYENAQDPEDKNPLSDVSGKSIKTTCKISIKNENNTYDVISTGISQNKVHNAVADKVKGKITNFLEDLVERGYDKSVVEQFGEALEDADVTDKFTKDSGRKLSMSGALSILKDRGSKMFADKAVRREFWNQYFEHHKEGVKLIQAGKL
jgi:hypothetical protein